MRTSDPLKKRAVTGLITTLITSILLLALLIGARVFWLNEFDQADLIFTYHFSFIIITSIIGIVGIRMKNKALGLGCGTAAGLMSCLMFPPIGIITGVLCLRGLHNPTFKTGWFQVDYLRRPR